MSRRSRRKTLSHADLEDFLCDLGEESNNDNLDSSSSLSSKSAQLVKTEDSPEDASVLESISDEQRVREFCKVRIRHILAQLQLYKTSVVVESNETNVNLHHHFKIQLQTRDENLNNVLAFEYGRVLLANTFYRILPMRKLHPELFEHPIESIGRS